MSSQPPDPIATAEAVLGLARQGRFGEIRDRFAAPLRPLVSPDALGAAWAAAMDQVGGVTSVGDPVAETAQGAAVVKIPLAGERGGLTLIVGMTPSGDLSGLQLAPPEAMAPVVAWEPPAYVDRERFDEEELTIGPGGLEVPATLSVPRDGRDLPAVVLLAGSGPLDRDETIGPNKPFRDLAWGLASRGIVVLRFDKVTHAHGAAARANSAFTVTDEYLPHALAAIDRLRTHPSVDRRRIVVAGHSLGGTVAPRIAAAAGDLAGLVIMAGGAAPLHWVIVRQLRHIASLDPSTEAAAQPGIAAMARQAQRVDARDLTVDTPASELPFGTPASYWLDIRDWDAPAAAAALGLPVLVLQGERDYQATVDDDLPRWRAALGDLAGTTIRVFPGLDHCFFPGSGPSSPQASMTPGQHVDPAVLDALVGWLEGLPPR